MITVKSLTLFLASQYSINKSKALLGLVGFDGQQRVVAQIDSALNRWLDSIPQHRKSLPVTFTTTIASVTYQSDLNL